MAGAGFTIDTRDARASLRRLIDAAANPQRILNTIGKLGLHETRLRFQKRGPGWPPKHPYFAELARRSGASPAPLMWTGILLKSLAYQVMGRDSVRVGSSDVKAATHQFGDPRTRTFVLHIIPDYEPGARSGGVRFARNAHGFLLGRVVGEADAAGAGRVGSRRQMVTLHGIRPRPFLKPPEGEEAQRLEAAIVRTLEAQA